MQILDLKHVKVTDTMYVQIGKLELEKGDVIEDLWSGERYTIKSTGCFLPQIAPGATREINCDGTPISKWHFTLELERYRIISS